MIAFTRRALLAGFGTAAASSALAAPVVPQAWVSLEPDLSPVEELQAALAKFKNAYEAVYPDVTEWIDVAGGFSIPVRAPTPVVWSGDGRYEVEEGTSRPVYSITREPRYDDCPERWFRISTGFKGPRERPDFCCPEHHLPKIARRIA